MIHNEEIRMCVFAILLVSMILDPARGAPGLRREPGARPPVDRQKALQEQLAAVNRDIASFEAELRSKDDALARIAELDRQFEAQVRANQLQMALKISRSIMQMLSGAGAPRARAMLSLHLPDAEELKKIDEVARRQKLDPVRAELTSQQKDLRSMNDGRRKELERLYALRTKLQAELRAR